VASLEGADPRGFERGRWQMPVRLTMSLASAARRVTSATLASGAFRGS
jgi:hypothetical protein